MSDDKELSLFHTAKPQGVEHHFYINDAIQEPDPFYEMFETLRGASPEDTICLHINCVGGRMSTTIQIVNAIRTSPATVVACAEGEVSSAAAIIFFACDGYAIADHSFFLIHNGEGGYIGKPNDCISHMEVMHRGMSNLYRDVFGRFLTEEEIADVMEGKEFYLLADEVKERIDDYVTSQQEEKPKEEEQEEVE